MGSTWNMVTSIGPRGWQHVILRGLMEHRIATEISDSIQIILLPRIELLPPDPATPFKMWKRNFPIKIAFAMTISKPQGQMLKRNGMYQPSSVFFPMDNSTWCFPDPLHVTALLLQLLKGIDKNRKPQVSNIKRCISRSALKFQICKETFVVWMLYCFCMRIIFTGTTSIVIRVPVPVPVVANVLIWFQQTNI
jgi:hypothetical protein